MGIIGDLPNSFWSKIGIVGIFMGIYSYLSNGHGSNNQWISMLPTNGWAKELVRVPHVPTTRFFLCAKQRICLVQGIYLGYNTWIIANPDRTPDKSQNWCQMECQRICQKVCQIESQNRCQKKCQKECQNIYARKYMMPHGIAEQIWTYVNIYARNYVRIDAWLHARFNARQNVG